jgi:ABC-type multidrug transport system ATPase subunit
MTKGLITLENVVKWYGRQLVVIVDNLIIRSDDRILLLGRNGSGKSTLLRILAGIARPSSGVITKSQPMTVGFVPQLGGLYGDMTLRQNLWVFQKAFSTRGTEKLVGKEFLEDAGLGASMDVPVSKLSIGFRKMAALGCVLAAPGVEALLLDEPMADLDTAHKEQVKFTLERTKLQFLVVSAHDTGTIDFERHLVLEDGRAK